MSRIGYTVFNATRDKYILEIFNFIFRLFVSQVTGDKVFKNQIIIR